MAFLTIVLYVMGHIVDFCRNRPFHLNSNYSVSRSYKLFSTLIYIKRHSEWIGEVELHDYLPGTDRSDVPGKVKESWIVKHRRADGSRQHCIVEPSQVKLRYDDVI